MSSIYTGNGDAGRTSLARGGRVPKDHPRVEAYGAVDEACSQVGVARSLAEDELLRDVLSHAQNRLYRYAGLLAVAPEAAAEPDPALAERLEADVAFLERAVDRFEAATGALDRFILPGGAPLAAQLFLARSVVRRAERRVAALGQDAPSDAAALRYLNRLSDTLFAAARFANHDADRVEKLWEPDAPEPTL